MASNNLQAIRGIARELRKVHKGKISENPMYQYVSEQARKFSTTQEQLCKAKEEMSFMANTYLCYLRSNRLHTEINAEFHGKGERTVAETARMVGFKLPHDPK